jgi:L-iditol 2-dehydrogenase
MKAAIYYGPGETKFEERPIPTPGPGEILMKNVSATTCGTDLKQYRRGYRTDKPGESKIFGHESAGVVAEVGAGVTKFKPGDKIAPHNSAPCGCCYWCKREQYSLCEGIVFAPGAWAEYRLIPASVVEKNTFIIPEHVSYRLAACVEPLSCAVYSVDQSGLVLMDTVVINGAGPLGLFHVITAKLRGAYVIVCDSVPFRLECAKKLGADQIVNIKEVSNQVDAVRELTPDKRGVDIAFDCTGLPEIWEMNMDMVRNGGVVMEFGGCKGGSTVTFDCGRLHYAQITVKGLFHTIPRVVEESFDMITRGLIPEDIIIGKTFPLEKFQDALDSHATGLVVKNEIRCEQ